MGVPKAKRPSVSKKATLTKISNVLDEHGKQLAEHSKRLEKLVPSDELHLLIKRVEGLEELPGRMRTLSHEFAKLREDVTAPIGRLSLDQWTMTRVLLGLADKAGVEVPEKLRARILEGQ